MSDILRLKRPDSLSKIAEEHIRRGIINGTFCLGEKLQEARLSKVFGISKTPIREALVALSLQGLVQIIPQRGAFVFNLSQESVKQLCRYRLILETAAMTQAFDMNTAAFLDELEGLVAKMLQARAVDAFEEYLELDADFHDTFFKHCGNSYLKDGYQNVSDIVRTMRTHLSKRPKRIEKSFKEHAAITEHLRNDKVKAAKTVLMRQITRGERSYSDLIGLAQLDKSN